MKIESFVILVLLSAFYQASAQNVSNADLQCYDCDPANYAESCANPGTNVPLTNCANKYPSPEANSTYHCISSYITFFGANATNTGIYRGCNVQGPSVVDICDWLKQETENKGISLTSCSNCTTRACNNATFNSVGDILTGGAIMHTMAVTLLMMTAVSLLQVFLHSIC